MEASSASAVPRSSATAERQARGRRRGSAAADTLADSVSTPSFRGSSPRRVRRRGRRVTRIVRRVELWSVLKVGLVFNTIMLGVSLGAVAILWGLANTTGLIDDLEGFLQDAGFEDFRFRGEQMFQQVAFIGAVGALAATVFLVLAAALLNLISEITGGIRFVVIEEIIDEEPAVRLAPAALALPVVPSVAATSTPAPPRSPGQPRPVAPPRPAPPVGLGKSQTDDRTALAPRPAAPADRATKEGGTGRPTGPRKRVSPAKGGRARNGEGPRPDTDRPDADA